MSRPGYWKTKDAGEIPYSRMENSHVKHALRYLRKTILATDTKPNYRVYCEGKLIELGEEAQRRGIITSEDITTDALMAQIEVWQTEWDSRRTVMPVIQSSIHTPSNIDLSNIFNTIPTPISIYKPRISVIIDVDKELSRVTGLRIYNPNKEYDEGMFINRRLDMEL
jgi:hypothetical protein